MKKTYYDVLGVPRNADEKAIRAAYRKLVLLYHPDRNSDDGAAEDFLRVSKAWEVLGDPARRKGYDELIRQTEERERKAKSKPSSGSPAESLSAKRSPPATADLVRLTALLNRTRYNEAEALAQRLTRTHPTEALPYAVLGDIARYRGDLREAARLYALAAQMDPRNPVYLRKHEELVGTKRRAKADDEDAEERSTYPLMVGSGIVIASGAYLGLSHEPTMFGGDGPIGTWTLGLVVMLFLCGVTMGACLTLAGYLDRFWAVRGAAVMRYPPSLVLGLVALVNFWAAVALYLGVGASQNAFNPSTSRLVGAVAIVTGILALACGISHEIKPMETLTWGGNVAYLGALCGWMVVDGFRE
ncbi:MAG TPA: DnaJ domain-containing protein [Fimbriimonadaceae bacterium]|nr:DnaJ domain-containing protein [Fimbriimonadaceae bacterium]HRJ97222.1 DnaJ domain-containing protein [Fimbriimonadaceae bacterium]